MIKTNFMTAILFMAAVFSFVACSDDSTDPTPATTSSNTIVDVAKANNFTILVEALERVDLAETLQGEGPYTVFAPTDDAFTALLEELKIDGLDKVTDAQLTQILLNHVVSGTVLSSELEMGYVNTLADGPQETKASLYVNLEDGVLLNNRGKVTTPNVEASNGIVHIIDRVLLVPNVVDAAVANPNFSILVAALTDERLTSDFVEILSGTGPFTVFAPTDEAFVALLESNEDWSELADIPVETLEAVLKYHVIASDNVTSSEIMDGSMPETFEGSTITLNTTSGVTVTDANEGVATVQIADVQTSNGVLHAINKVLLP